jgi:hypothetical protein
VIEEEGPFDGVLGFSQGSSIAASLMLDHEINHPRDPPPFSFAILFSCFMVVSPDINYARMEYRLAHEKYSEVAWKVLQDGELSKVSNEKDDAEFFEETELSKISTLALEANKKDEKNGKRENTKKYVKAPTNRLELLRPSKRAALVVSVRFLAIYFLICAISGV